MYLSWILGLCLAVQALHVSESIPITKDGQTVATFNIKEFFYTLPDLPIMNTNKFGQFLDQLDKKVSTPPKDASLDERGTIIPEQLGTQIYRQVLTEQLYSYYFNRQQSQIEVPMITAYPKVDSELLSDINSMRIGRYVTSYNPYNKNRSVNIKIATKAINNYVVFPGETFSFNKIVGKRTEDRGYMRAPVIIRGEVDEDIGGGICQVSSTLYNAVDNAGLKIIQRYSHSRKVPYIPPGRDATVSWYGPDFVFKNSYDQPILIRARTLGGMLIISVYTSEGIKYNPRQIPPPPY
ncbi:VanW family protein [Neobacillus dielmonensis]|uniref:VanW family protein n=1 Tax=Neobacillus dielmonensis TaxID=1347369 RepID=UPI0005AAC9CE|nr:VanW family protein [Neobacillus dielmonensis]